MRGMRLAALAGIAGAMWAADVAHAEQVIAAEPSNRFVPTSVTIAPGEALTFRNRDVVMHDVTSEQPGPDGKPLFGSRAIAGNRSAPVEHVEHLAPGSYAFLCSLHPEQMKGTLTVSGTSAPEPTPTPTPTPDAEDTRAPEVTLSGTFRAVAIRRSGRLALRVRSNEAARLVLTAKTGGKRLGRVSADLPKGHEKITVRLSRSARRAVRRGRRLKLVAVATDAAGNRRRSVTKVRLP